ncbi:MAG TPA: hypothetical protein VLS86_00185 [Acidimicrobiia bacterium]|nr:hypothetical protein [Acidimicrobiia bacterium]
MKRVLGLVLIVMILALALPVAATENANYKDKFDSIGWGGSNGSLPWSGPWSEIGDDNDEKYGSVRVVSSGNCPSGGVCMRISATLILTDIGARRGADLSVLQEPELCFDVVNIPDALSLPGTKLRVQVNTGSGWSTLDGGEWDLGDELEAHPTFDLSDFRAENFQVRFLVVGLLSTSEVFIDNVEITGELIETTTTTTVPDTTTSTQGDDGPATTTTTTKPDAPTTTTTIRATTTTRPSNTPGGAVDDITTSTTVASTTTTTEAGDGNDAILIGGGGGSDDGEPPGLDDSPAGSGIRQTARGLQANFDAGLYGDVSAISPITGVDYQARFSMTVEIIEATWAWIVLLALVIAWSIVSGMDRRKSQPLG